MSYAPSADLSTTGTNTLAHALGAMARHNTHNTIDHHNVTPAAMATTTTTTSTPTATTPTAASTSLALVSSQTHELALVSRLATMPEDRWCGEIHEDDWKALQSLLVTGTLGLSHCPHLLHQGQCSAMVFSHNATSFLLQVAYRYIVFPIYIGFYLPSMFNF